MAQSLSGLKVRIGEAMSGSQQNKGELKGPGIPETVAFRFRLRSLFLLTAIVAVLMACIEAGGASGFLFAVAAAFLCLSIWTTRTGRKRRGFWFSYLAVLIALAALFFKALAAGIHC